MHDRWTDIVKVISTRFKSGNQVPMERTYITRKEWAILLSYIDELNATIEQLEDFVAGQPSSNLVESVRKYKKWISESKEMDHEL